MTNEENKIELQLLKDNLIDNYVIYHERVTLLVQLTLFEIEDTRVNFKAKIIKPLDRLHAEKDKFYLYLITKNEISLGSTYLFADNTFPLLQNKKLGRPYCPYKLWFDPELANFCLENNDHTTRQIPDYILENEDWRVLKQNNKN